jgi:hypothetical protein
VLHIDGAVGQSSQRRMVSSVSCQGVGSTGSGERRNTSFLGMMDRLVGGCLKEFCCWEVSC